MNSPGAFLNFSPSISAIKTRGQPNARAATAVLLLVRRAGHRRTRPRPASARRRLHREAGPRDVGTLDQTTSRLHSHAVRLAGHRPDHPGKPGAFGPGATSLGQQGVNVGAVLRGSNHATGKHGCVNRGWPAGSRPDRGDDLHLRRRAGAVVALNVEDYYPKKNTGGAGCARKTARSMKCPAIINSKSISMLRSARRGIAEDRKGPLFHVAIGRTRNSVSARCRA